jgi:hypothetical protein
MISVIWKTRTADVTSRPKRLLAVLGIAVALAASAFAGQAQATTLTDAWLNCTFGSGVHFELPFQGSARTSQFYFRINGGQWYNSEFYYTRNADWYIYDSGRKAWQEIGYGGGFLPIYDVTGFVEAWESRYYPGGSHQWVNLGSCNAYSYHPGEGGIVLGGG